MLSEFIYLLHSCTLIVQFCEREKFMQVFFFVLFCGLYACVCFFQSLYLFLFSKKCVCSKLFIYFPFPGKQFKLYKHFGDMAVLKITRHGETESK